MAEYSMRRCGNDWKFCDGCCDTCMTGLRMATNRTEGIPPYNPDLMDLPTFGEIIHRERMYATESAIYKAILDVGISADKDKIAKALTNAREFYKQGYEKGLRDAARWIPVTERLPDEDGHYMVFEVWPYGNIISLAFYTPKYNGFEEHLKDRAVWYKYDSEAGDFEVTGVTHWMPLPESPKGE